MTLQALLERVEKAEGPDDALDIEMWLGVEGHFGNPCRLDTSERARMFEITERLSDDELYTQRGLGGKIDWSAPAYTASLDAAVGLVEKMLPGWDYLVCRTSGRACGEVGPPDTFQQISGDGATPALALIAALLKAMLAKGDA